MIQIGDKSFPSTNLKEALKYASSKEMIEDTVRVDLPNGEVIVKSSLTLAFEQGVEFQGLKTSRIVFTDGGSFSISKKSKVSFQNVFFSSEKKDPKSEILDINDATSFVSFKNCVFEPLPDPKSDAIEQMITVKGGDISCESSEFRSTCFFLEGSSFSSKDSSFEQCKDAIVSINSKVSLTKTAFSRLQSAVICSEKSSVSASDCKFDHCSVGIHVDSESIASKLEGIKMEEIGKYGIGGMFGSELFVSDFIISKGSGIGILLESKASAELKDIKIDSLQDCGVVVKEQVKLVVDSVTVSNCQKGALRLESVKEVRGKNVTLKGNLVDSLFVKGRSESEDQKASYLGDNSHLKKWNVEISNLNIENPQVGINLEDTDSVLFVQPQVMNASEVGVKIKDSSCKFFKGVVINQKTEKVGALVLFDESTKEQVVFKEVKFNACSEGVKVVQKENSSFLLKGRKEEQEEEQDLVEDETPKMSQLTLQNCSFIKNTVSFYVDSALSLLQGCSFIMSKQHSVFIKNHEVKSSQRTQRKRGNLCLSWPNYVEPLIDNTTALSNDPRLLTQVTKEKAFLGSSSFEPDMYMDVMMERLKEAKSMIESPQKNRLERSKIIMQSVLHMLILLKDLSKSLLKTQLIDDPELGMFTATFVVNEGVNAKRKTLIDMTDLFESWKKLTKPKAFDAALKSLNIAFEKKQVSEELYDAWMTPLEELQRKRFVLSKYNRRREYMLETANEDPLKTWFFLEKESAKSQEGKRLRKEILLHLAKDDAKIYQNQESFHASWVSKWAVNMLGESFTKGEIPSDPTLRRAWCDQLLDQGQAKRVLAEYQRVGEEKYKTPMDEMMRFEAYVIHEDQGNKLTTEEHNKVSTLLQGQGFGQAVKNAGKLFKGNGALPGFLRRVAAKAQSDEALLDALKHIHEDNTVQSSKKKREVILAVMSYFYHPDSMDAPLIKKRAQGSYETCSMCLTQKLQPWNELRLESCKFKHHFCKNCFKNSMSSAVTNLWGTCAGMVDDNKPCTALASRREMEMAGMEKDKIYNILNARVVAKLQSIKGWKQCDSPGCIGGRSNVVQNFYSCRLCEKMVTLDGGKSDPTVSKKLLRGLDGTKIPRGEGLFRECYHCAVIYEKGNACSTITCSHCQKQFSMTFGNEQVTHRFDEEGVGPQRYVPLKAGKLWDLGVFKNKDGSPLEMGQKLNDSQVAEMIRRSKALLAKLDG